MQFSQLEREMHNSPLKCSTNTGDQLSASPDKQASSSMLQNNAYRNSSSKQSAANIHVSPTKTNAGASRAQYSPSPDKQSAAA